MREDDWVGCEYVATVSGDQDPCPTGHSDSEIVQGMAVRCKAAAEVVIQLQSARGSTRHRQVVCGDHAEFLLNEKDEKWEQVGGSERVEALRLADREVQYTTNE